MEKEGSLPRLQVPATCPYSEYILNYKHNHMAKAIVRVLAMIYYPSDYLDSEPIDSE
jgi:hypothetical protein